MQNRLFDIQEAVAESSDELIALRRDFHAHPELGLQEYRTAQIIEEYLNKLKIPTKRYTETGVVGILTGGRPGKTVMLRSDIDALPIEEQTNLPFASQTPGVMHACGHDGHTAIQQRFLPRIARSYLETL